MFIVQSQDTTTPFEQTPPVYGQRVGKHDGVVDKIGKEDSMATIEIDNTKHEVPAEVAGLLQAVSEERDELKDFAIWMTGCGYDFCQHEYFCKKRDELLKG